MVYSISGIRLPTVPLNNSAGARFHADRRIVHLSFNRFSGRFFLEGHLVILSPHLSLYRYLRRFLFRAARVIATKQFDIVEVVLEDSGVSGTVDSLDMEKGSKAEGDDTYDDSEQDSPSLSFEHADDKMQGMGTLDALEENISDESERVKESASPPPGLGQRIYETDPMLNSHRSHLDYRYSQYKKTRDAIDKYEGGFPVVMKNLAGITYREWAPGAKFMTSEHQYISRKDEGDRVIVFERGDLVFVFNFHWNNSYSDYPIGCHKPGKIQDDALFGGFNRLDGNVECFTFEGWQDNRTRSFLVYAPARTVAVYALTKDEVKLDIE